MNLITILKSQKKGTFANTLFNLFNDHGFGVSDFHNVQIKVEGIELDIRVLLGLNDTLSFDITSDLTSCYYTYSLHDLAAKLPNGNKVCLATPVESAYNLLINSAKQMLADYQTFLKIIDTPLTGDFSEEYLAALDVNSNEIAKHISKEGNWKINHQQQFKVPTTVNGIEGHVSINATTLSASIATYGRYASTSGYHSHAGINASIENQSIRNILKVFAERDYNENAPLAYINKDCVRTTSKVIDGETIQFTEVILPATINKELIDAIATTGLKFNYSGQRFTKGNEKPFCYANPDEMSVKECLRMLKPLLAKGTFLADLSELAGNLKSVNTQTKKQATIIFSEPAKTLKEKVNQTMKLIGKASKENKGNNHGQMAFTLQTDSPTSNQLSDEKNKYAQASKIPPEIKVTPHNN